MQDSIRQLKKAVDSSIRDPGARLLQKAGINSPNMLTVLGVAFTVLFAITLNVTHIPWLAAVVLLVGELFDLFDGPLARLQPEGSRNEHFGAWLDTTSDRFNEAIILGGLATYFADKDSLLLAFAAFIAGFLVTFVKTAAGEKDIEVNWDDRAILGYPGRVIIIMTGLFLTGILKVPAETILLWTMGVLLVSNAGNLYHRISKVIKAVKAKTRNNRNN